MSELVLMAVTTTSRSEVDWITEGIGRLFPDEWEAFRAASDHLPNERLVEAYARRLASFDAQDRWAAAAAWNEWESTHVSLDPNFIPVSRHFQDARALVFATLVTHYWANDGFLGEGAAVLDRMAVIEHIPAVLIHGRRDFSGPLITPWKLHRHGPPADWSLSKARDTVAPSVGSRCGWQSTHFGDLYRTLRIARRVSVHARRTFKLQMGDNWLASETVPT